MAHKYGVGRMLNARRNFWREVNATIILQSRAKSALQIKKLLSPQYNNPRIFHARIRSSIIYILYTKIRILFFKNRKIFEITNRAGAFVGWFASRGCFSAKCDCQGIDPLICPIRRTCSYLHKVITGRTVFSAEYTTRKYAPLDSLLSATNNGQLNKMYGRVQLRISFISRGWQRWITTATAI